MAALGSATRRSGPRPERDTLGRTPPYDSAPARRFDGARARSYSIRQRSLVSYRCSSATPSSGRSSGRGF
eukprot:2967554-Pyramimonas_sp.AAC.1